MDIKTWLEEIGMGEYWEKFELNKIDEKILEEMTEDDLQSIGVDALGDRKKLKGHIDQYFTERSVELEVWLNKVGMGSYYEKLEEDKFDEKNLQKMTEMELDLAKKSLRKISDELKGVNIDDLGYKEKIDKYIKNKEEVIEPFIKEKERIRKEKIDGKRKNKKVKSKK